MTWIPERLWERILDLGRAYRLHVLGLLEGQERFELNPPQIESLLDELQFLASRVNDDLVLGHLEELRAAAARVVNESLPWARYRDLVGGSWRQGSPKPRFRLRGRVTVTR